ncbi:hypothetical protein Tco_0527567, partial [Tanacetum coccineum]
IDAVKALEDTSFPLVDLLKSKKDVGMDELLVPIYHVGDKTAVEETSLSFALMNIHARAKGAKKHALALRQLMIEIVSMPLSSQTWVGETSTSASPLSIEDYTKEDTDKTLGSVVVVPKLESTFAVWSVGMPISACMTASVPYVSENGVSPMLDFIMAKSANNVHPYELLHLISRDSRNRLCFNPFGEVVNSYDQELDFAWMWDDRDSRAGPECMLQDPSSIDNGVPGCLATYHPGFLFVFRKDSLCKFARGILHPVAYDKICQYLPFYRCPWPVLDVISSSSIYTYILPDDCSGVDNILLLSVDDPVSLQQSVWAGDWTSGPRRAQLTKYTGNCLPPFRSLRNAMNRLSWLLRLPDVIGNPPFLCALLQGFERRSWIFQMIFFDRDLFKLASFPFSLCTSLRHPRDGRLRTASALSGHTFSPSVFTL